MPGTAPLPPLFTTAEPESFALRSIRDRHTASLLSVIKENDLEEPYRSRMLAFRNEALGGALTDPFARDGWDPGLFHPQELADWRRELDPLVGRSWYDLPWYFAEAFFFLALLFAFGYYEAAGPHRLQDPFAPLKRGELTGGGLEAASGLTPFLADTAPPTGALRELLLASLWGNRVDLSVQRVAGTYRGSFLNHEEREILVDHTGEATERLQAARRVDFILDNSGPELICDLLLAAWLLLREPRRRVVLHAKHSPFYVSDATPTDVRTAIEALAGSPDALVHPIGQRLRRELEEGRLALKEHWFWNGPLFFCEMPRELRRELAASDLVLIKGDASYRRLVGDHKWPPTTRMETLTRYFPAPLAVLRTLKSELVIDLEPGQAERLDLEDPEWRTNGRRGIIRLVGGGTRKMLEYLLPGGWRALAGRTDTENDHLSMRLARPNDRWFHVRGVPGSHVVLQGPAGAEPGRETLKQAAAIAAYHSKARQGGEVAVSCTLARYVTKPHGAKPGTVRIRKEIVLKVRPGLPSP